MNPDVKSLRGKRVYVGLSGGVDSAVTASLLCEQGALVTGVFIKGWYPPGLPCTWATDRRDAMRVAARLGIQFETLDASAKYKQSVIEYLIREYGAGRTPNPDIFCNRDVKFGAYFRYAKAQGADFIATGHYAQTRGGRLYRGSDPAKDQSYFLWAVPHDALAETLFPLGELTKSEVRTIATTQNLPVADKKDSQGICFLGSISIEEFLRSELTVAPGKAVDESGNHIGTHDGSILYTLGERISLREASRGPWYVQKKDLITNTLTVSLTRKTASTAKAVLLEQPNFFRLPEEGKQYTAQYRYHGPIITGTLTKEGAVFTPEKTLLENLSEGQSLVIYEDDECIGGGIIAG